MSLTKKQKEWLTKKLNKAQNSSGKLDLTEKGKQQIWNEFEAKYGNITISVLEVPLGLLPGVLGKCV